MNDLLRRLLVEPDPADPKRLYASPAGMPLGVYTGFPIVESDRLERGQMLILDNMRTVIVGTGLRRGVPHRVIGRTIVWAVDRHGPMPPSCPTSLILDRAYLVSQMLGWSEWLDMATGKVWVFSVCEVEELDR